MSTERRKRTAYDLAHVKSVSVWAFWFEGKQAGKMVANWSDNPAGSVCTATVSLWAGPFKELPKKTASAGGGGYDKLCACLEEIFGAGCPGGGSETVASWLEKEHGYDVFRVI